ncbi:MAG TPA: hypothetical protein VGV92_00320 [Gammaproteobacteria bacterium]|nr:hypothetical protein [Gammaproteobacteria bacterium]
MEDVELDEFKLNVIRQEDHSEGDFLPESYTLMSGDERSLHLVRERKPLPSDEIPFVTLLGSGTSQRSGSDSETLSVIFSEEDDGTGEDGEEGLLSEMSLVHSHAEESDDSEDNLNAPIAVVPNLKATDADLYIPFNCYHGLWTPSRWAPKEYVISVAFKHLCEAVGIDYGPVERSIDAEYIRTFSEDLHIAAFKEFVNTALGKRIWREAIEDNDACVLKLFLAFGDADVNQEVLGKRISSIHYAMECGSLYAAQMLILHVADISASGGISFIDRARTKGSEVVKFFVRSALSALQDLRFVAESDGAYAPRLLLNEKNAVELLQQLTGEEREAIGEDTLSVIDKPKVRLGSGAMSITQSRAWQESTRQKHEDAAPEVGIVSARHGF